MTTVPGSSRHVKALTAPCREVPSGAAGRAASGASALAPCRVLGTGQSVSQRNTLGQLLTSSSPRWPAFQALQQGTQRTRRSCGTARRLKGPGAAYRRVGPAGVMTQGGLSGSACAAGSPGLPLQALPGRRPPELLRAPPACSTSTSTDATLPVLHQGWPTALTLKANYGT